MSSVPCAKNPTIQSVVDDYVEALHQEAHKIGNHGYDEAEFHRLGIFRGAIEQIRGKYSAGMADKRHFVSAVLNHLQDRGLIRDWHSAGGENRHDYTITMLDDRISVIELKGCLDGNNTNIFERPPHADEFVIWSVCTNPTSDPRHNVWSGIHTRLSSEIIHRTERVDGLIVWDWLCGSSARPCPKLLYDPSRANSVGRYSLAPPCIYLFPRTVPSPRNNPDPEPHLLRNVAILETFSSAFGCLPSEINSVRMATTIIDNTVTRQTVISRDGQVARKSRPTKIKRS